MFAQIKQKNPRVYLFIWHLLVSAMVALGVAFLVFWLWFPYPYGQMTRGLNLFLLIIAVDVVCGPLITLVLANPKKSKRELMLDLSLVALIQFGALAYGMYKLEEARPVLISFERDRMALIVKSEIDWQDIDNAPTELQKVPLVGVKHTGIRRAKSEAEFFESVNLGMEGIEPSVRPSWWIAYSEVLSEVKEKMHSMNTIDDSKLDTQQSNILNKAIKKTGKTKDELFYLPFVSNQTKDWIVLLDSDANFVGYAHMNGYDLQNEK